MPYRCLYSPIKIGAMEVPNRFVVPPMGNNFANSDGSWSDQSRAYYEARAAGGVRFDNHRGYGGASRREGRPLEALPL